MNKKIYSIFIVIGVLFLNACSKIEFESQKISKNDTIVAFGDSLTNGMGASKENSYPAQLEILTGYSVINAGKNGDTAEYAKERLIETIEEYEPKLIILGLGGNDMLKGKSNLEQNLKDLVNTIKERNIQVVLIATPEPNFFKSAIGALDDADVYEKVSKDTNTYLVKNVYSKYLSDNDYKSDQIHLNAKGYSLVAKDIAKELKDAGFIE